tara:strand:- start:1102 stop:1347 length:246 start_codon:yes stop_codon:yes gene_type:complete
MTSNKHNFIKGIPDHVCIDWLAQQIVDGIRAKSWITHLINNLDPVVRVGIVKSGIQSYDEDDLHYEWAVEIEEQKTKDYHE